MDQKPRKRLGPTLVRSDQGTLTLRELSDAAASGERAVFDEVHARLDAIVRRFMRDRGADPALSDDLSQRVWVAVWQACREGKYDPSRAAISTFVYAVSSNVWLQHLRSRHAERSRDARTDAIASLGVDIRDAERASDFARTAEAIELVRLTMRTGAGDPANAGGLTAREIEALRATGEDVTDRDLAQRLAVSPSTAHATRKAALAKLASVLRRAGFLPDVASTSGDGAASSGAGSGARISQIPPSAATQAANSTPRASS